MPPLRLAAASLAAALLFACGDGRSNPSTQPDPCRLDAPVVEWLAFASNRSGGGDVYRAHVDGTCVHRVTTDPGADVSPAWTPGGELGFSSTRQSGEGIYVHGTASGDDTGIPVINVAAVAPQWSPDGLWIVFEGKLPGDWRSDIYVVLSTGGLATALTTGPGINAGPVWSHDGSTIYFVSTRTGAYQIYSMAASGGGQVAVPGTSGVLGRPAVSPDSTALAYSRLDASQVAEVVVHDLDTHAEHVASDLGDTDPAFDATGQRLAVSSTREGNPAIWIVDAADGQHAVRVTTPTGVEVDGQPAFRW